MLLAASIVAFTDSRGLLTVVLAIALIYLGPTIRVVRALTLTISNRDFVLSARSLGATDARVMRREILPNVVPTLLSMMVVAVAGAVVAEGPIAQLLGARFSAAVKRLGLNRVRYRLDTQRFAVPESARTALVDARRDSRQMRLL